MFLLEWSATDLIAIAVASAAIIGTVVWIIPSARSLARIEFTEEEIHAYDARLPRYFIVATAALVVGAAHTVVKNLPGFWTWLWEAGYGGHLFRDLANSHIVIVGGGTIMLTGLTWYALPRILGRPLFSSALATASLWLTVIGVFGFYLAWVILGLVEGSLVRDGMTYAMAKETVGAWHRVPTRATASIMGVGYWVYVFNVVLTVWPMRWTPSTRYRHLTKFFTVSALALFVGTVQGVLQVLPASADWIAAAGSFGEYVDPISHAHINLVTGMMVFLAGVFGLVSPKLGVPVSRLAANRTFWTLALGSIVFYLAFLLIGLVGGGVVVGHGGIQSPLLESLLLTEPTVIIAAAGTLMLLGFWMYFIMLGRSLIPGDRNRREVGPATFWMVSAGFLIVGTLHGVLQTIPATAKLLTTAEEVPNIHAQLNMIGGVVLALIGTVYVLLPELGCRKPHPAQVRRSLVGIAGGIGTMYVITLVSGVIRGTHIARGEASVAAAERLTPLTPLLMTFAALLALWGILAFARAVLQSTVDFRTRQRLARQEAPARIAGPTPTGRPETMVRTALITEATGGIFGWPGIGWLRSRQPFVGIPLLLIGPAVSWAFLPMLGATSDNPLLANSVWRVIFMWLGTTTLVSTVSLAFYLWAQSARTPKRADTPSRVRIPKPLLLGGAGVLIALVSVPLIVASGSTGQLQPDSYPVMDALPDRAAGLYAHVDTPDGAGYVKLFSWATHPQGVPAETPTIAPENLIGLIAAQKGLDEFDKYRVYQLPDGNQIPLVGGPSLDGRRMSLSWSVPPADGSYLIDIPIGGMFAGREYYYLNVGPDESPLVYVGAAPEPTATPPPGVEAPDWLSTTLVSIAAITATLFALDLAQRYFRRRSPHTGAYAMGMAMFSVATWAMFVALTFGWSGWTFRVFYLFGAILNVPWLALGSWLLWRRGKPRTAVAVVAVFSALATWVTVTSRFVAPLPVAGVPEGSHMFEFFGPRVWAALAGGLGATLLIGLSLATAIKFRRTNQNLAVANLLITAGVLAAAWGGAGLALGESSGFAVSLVLAASLIWIGHRIATARPRQSTADPAPNDRRQAVTV